MFGFLSKMLSWLRTAKFWLDAAIEAISIIEDRARPMAA